MTFMISFVTIPAKLSHVTIALLRDLFPQIRSNRFVPHPLFSTTCLKTTKNENDLLAQGII